MPGGVAEAHASTRLFRIFKDKKFGFIDRSGKVVIEPKFDWVEDFSEGLALVDLNRTKEFIDETGKVVLVPKDFEVINGFTDGLARGNITNQSSYTKGYIDKSGKLVIDTKASGACEFSEGLACVPANKWGFIDTSGQFVIKPQFDEVSYFHDGLATFTVWDQSKASRHQQGYLDKTGTIVVKPQYDIAQWFSEGLAAVGVRDGDDDYQFGFIDKTGA
ncbi:MAG: WG repeat-containing protein, partial [Pyrinomonadaceae bacterium]